MEDFYKFVQAKVMDDIDFQRGRGCSELNRADFTPCSGYLHFYWLRLVKSVDMILMCVSPYH